MKMSLLELGTTFSLTLPLLALKEIEKKKEKKRDREEGEIKNNRP